MATTKSNLVRAAVALCAVTAGGLVWAGLDTGAEASAVPPARAEAGAAAPSLTPSPPASAAEAGAPTEAAPEAPSEPAGQAAQAPPSAEAAPDAPAGPAPGTAAPAPKGGERAPAALPAPLPPAQLPANAAASWKPIAPPNTQAVTHDVRLNECATVKGATTWQQQGYVSAFRTPAIQDTFSYRDAAAAQQAYADLRAAMDACRDTSRALQCEAKLPQDAEVTTTATTDDGTAYARQWTAVAGQSAPGPQTGHVYLVRRDNVLAVIQFAVPDGTPGTSGAGAPTEAEDRSALTGLADRLSTAPAAPQQH
ncbi:hypothetical protein ACGF13_21255 [Kitasatospora sp. NPDC048286]|uniref:hypothetical protein n=1 Tax=Kitasatospora sp. NPDC048286 TaxID=3364047 RepID=UPI00371AB5B4